MSKTQRFIQIDEEGYFLLDQMRVADAEAGQRWIASLRPDGRGSFIADIGDVTALVEAFDEPYIALDVEKGPTTWTIRVPYGHQETFSIDTLTLDEWDRFHGRTERGVPFVFSRSAQARFFNLLDSFEDDAITVDGRRIETKPWLQENPDANNVDWWSELYRTNGSRWELNAPAPALPSFVPRLKLQRSRILIAGAGSGNDAAWFAEQGHIVTAIDFSEEAVSRAQAKYGHLDNLKFQRADVFNLPTDWTGAFDIVFEHTLYCAINPSKRNDLVKVWRRVLSDQGYLMGVFFAFDKPFGPPFGGSEWEIRARLEKKFRPLYWTRVHDSIEGRLGQELFVFAQKLSRT